MFDPFKKAFGQNSPLQGWRDIQQGAHFVQNKWDHYLGSGPVGRFLQDVPDEVERRTGLRGPDPYSAESPIKLPDQTAEQSARITDAEETARGQSAEMGSEAANPLNWIQALNPEGYAAKLALFAGVPAVQSMLSEDQSRRDSGIMWAGITGALLSGGHLGPAKSYLEKAMPGVAKSAQDAIDLNQQAKRISQNPGARTLSDSMQQELDAANELRTAKTPKVKAAPNVARDPVTGEIAQELTPKLKKERQKLMKRFGVQNQKELESYAFGHELSPEDSQYLAKHYKATLFTDPLLYQDLPEGEYLNPMRHWDGLKGDAQRKASQALAGFHSFKELADQGTMNADDPAIGTLRGAAGWNQALHQVMDQFSTSLRNIDPKLDGVHLMRVIETGGTASPEYEGLSTEGKFVVDLYRTFANMASVYQRRAGIDVGRLGSYVPRLSHLVPLAQKRGGSPARILVSDFSKSRQWRIEATPKLRSISPSELAPIKRYLGRAATSLSDDHLAAVHQLVEKLGQEDGEHLLQQLRASPKDAKATIEHWATQVQDQTPESLRLQAVQAYPTVRELNQEMARRRDSFAKALISDPQAATKMVGGDLDLKDPELRRIAKEGDTEAARSLAAQYFTPYIDDLFGVLDTNHFTRQFTSAHAAEVVKTLEDTEVQLGKRENGQPLSGPAAVMSRGGRADRPYEQRGYRRVDVAPQKYQGYLFAPEVAKFIERGSRQRDMGFIDKLGTLTSKSKGLIMWNSLYHGWNVASRLGAAAIVNPRMTAHWVKTQRDISKLAPADKEAVRLAQETEAHMDGLVTPHDARRIGSDHGSALANALGDQSIHDLGIVREPGKLGQAVQNVAQNPLFQKVRQAHDVEQRWLWNKVHDFGVMMYHVEKQGAINAGVEESNAGRWAARRANSWMGMVSDLDHNPNLHALTRTAVFAPNYWRTFAELMAPIYRNSGIDWTPQMKMLVARKGVAGLMGMLAIQKMSGEVMNYATSGHWQQQNQPGQQDRIEVSNPEIINLLKTIGWGGAQSIDPNTGQDPKTGAKMYMDNPLGRQQMALEEVTGMMSGYQNWQPEDVPEGISKTIAAKLSPLVSAAGTGLNIDVYHTISTRQIQNVNAEHDAPDASNAALAILALTPLGLSIPQLAQEFQGSNHPMQMQTGPYGTTVPKWVNDELQGIKELPTSIIGALTGVNPPYPRSEKTRGQQLSSEDRRRAQAVGQTYDKQSLGLAQQLFSGQITPEQWRERHQRLADQRSGRLDEIYGGSPQAAGGTMGLVSQWEALYDQSTDPNTGTLDPDKLARAQAQFESQHSQSDLDAMHAQLSKNAQKDPALAFYNKTLNSYYDWQRQWAATQGVSAQQIQSESREYGQLYATNSRQAQAYLRQHPDLRKFQQAKKSQFYKSPQGQAYQAFFGQALPQDESIASLAEGAGVDTSELRSRETA